MNLVKNFSLLRCCLKNISCNGNILTIEDARNKYKDCQYVVVNALSGNPVWICKTIEDAKETVEESQLYDYVPLLIVNLWKNEEKEE